MVIETAGRHVGKTFTHLEIDSYEAGGQTWSPALPEEFSRRKGYDILPYLPYMLGRLKEIEGTDNTARFRKDWQDVVIRCRFNTFKRNNESYNPTKYHYQHCYEKIISFHHLHDAYLLGACSTYGLRAASHASA